jgi:hypothetical protein
LDLAESATDAELWVAARRENRSNPIRAQMAPEGGAGYHDPDHRAAIDAGSANGNVWDGDFFTSAEAGIECPRDGKPGA